MSRKDETPPQEVHFLLLPEFSVMCFVSAIEPLRVANRFRPGSYRWHILSLDGGPVVASNNMSINAEAAFSDAGAIETVFVVAGFNPLGQYRPALAPWLHACQRCGTVLGALDTGAFVLAEAGLLDAEPVTLHWEAMAAFSERYPQLRVTQELFEIGQRVITCAGGTAAIDMVLAMITARHGRELAARVSEQFVLGRIRRQSDHQRMEIAARYGLHNRKTIQIVKLMQEHIEDPLSADDLASMISVTRRQLERLFSTHLHETPSRFYVGVRLQRARELLQQTDMGILAVGVACGFGSSSHFSRAYRGRFGMSPKDDRGRLTR
ncbi:MAG: GlxA family transcriptional regulator [Rhodoferax sp.]|nr:GlxA family transcriptional regulator [Rhodoferax sp.]